MRISSASSYLTKSVDVSVRFLEAILAKRTFRGEVFSFEPVLLASVLYIGNIWRHFIVFNLIFYEIYMKLSRFSSFCISQKHTLAKAKKRHGKDFLPTIYRR